MTEQEQYIKYLEATTEIQAARIHELEANLMAMVAESSNDCVRSSVVLSASKCLVKSMPYSDETRKLFTEIYGTEPGQI